MQNNHKRNNNNIKAIFIIMIQMINIDKLYYIYMCMSF